MINQISVYTENRKGAMRQLLAKLSQARINVLGFVTNEGGEFGTVRLVVSDTDTAVDILEKAGYLCRRSKVLGIELPDRPGTLEELTEIFECMNINVDYMYVGYVRESNVPVIMLHCSDMDMVSDSLKRKGYILY